MTLLPLSRRMKGSVNPILANAEKLRPINQGEPVQVMFVLGPADGRDVWDEETAIRAIARVRRFAVEMGLEIEEENIGGRFVVVHATANLIERAFRIELGTYGLGDLRFFGHREAISLPQSL